ncbi:MAG: OsmC family protein [Chloroflexi bacterium]|nr:OsmC family protein [Chloroflexota bacterium]
MATRTAEAVWTGSLREGSGEFSVGSEAVSGEYTFDTRFEDKPGTNPEELIGAAHAACFSMALSAGLGRAGFEPNSIKTTANVHFSKQDAGWRITKIDLVCEADVPNIEDDAFQEQANDAKANCPISAVLDTEITLDAKLV